MAKTYLVTGGAGFIGAALVKRLVEKGMRVRTLDNGSRGGADRLSGLKGGVERIQADIREAAAVRAAARGVDAIVHLAFVNGTEFFYSRPDLVLNVGVRGVLNVLDACRDEGVEDLSLVSSSEVYHEPPRIPADETVPLTVPDPLNPRFSYSSAKIISEMLVLHAAPASVKRVTIVRPHNVFGPAMGFEHVIPQFIMRMRELTEKSREDPVPFPVQGTGKETRAFIYIDDFVEGMMRVLERGESRSIYHVGTMDEVNMADLAGMVAAHFGRKVKVIPGEGARGGPARRCPDTARLKSLGFTSIASLSDGLGKTVEWYRANAHVAEK